MISILCSLVQTLALSEELGLPAETVRRSNFYNRTMETPFGQSLKYCNLEGVWDHIYATADYDNRKQNVEKFNDRNVLKKRGIKIIPLKYGISFTHKSMNQCTSCKCVKCTVHISSNFHACVLV